MILLTVGNFPYCRNDLAIDISLSKFDKGSRSLKGGGVRAQPLREKAV